jgi:hypothetical protein
VILHKQHPLQAVEHWRPATGKFRQNLLTKFGPGDIVPLAIFFRRHCVAGKVTEIPLRHRYWTFLQSSFAPIKPCLSLQMRYFFAQIVTAANAFAPSRSSCEQFLLYKSN